MNPNRGNDGLWKNARLTTMAKDGSAYGIGHADALLIQDGKITWLGRSPERPDLLSSDNYAIHDAGGRWVTPGLIDCHTHLVYAGNRAKEFELRLQGASYEDIARAGGGIRSTVQATREASEEELYFQSRPRLEALMSEGVTTVEIKSGYGLTRDDEIKMLSVAQKLDEDNPVTIKKTFLGAHAVPEEFQERADDYVDNVCAHMLPAAVEAGLVDAVDGFCENIAFDVEQTRRVFEKACSLDIPVKLHAEQLSDRKGAVLAAEFGALSADHLEYVQEDGVSAMAAAGTVAVLLPGAFYFLRETQLPPLQLIRDYGVPIALATDSNPGSSPTTSLLLMLNMACTLFRMTPEEALLGVTRNAARALGIQSTHGTLEVGKAADFVLWDIDHPAELAYRIGGNPCYQVVKNGEIIQPLL